MKSSAYLRVGLSVTLALALAGTLAAVAVNPIALYIGGRERSTVITLYNDGARPEEVQIAFAFGYPRSDSLGRVAVELADTAAAGEPAATPWLTAFPRRVVLQPGERQAVRILVEPPRGTADGEYWARVLVKSRGGEAPIEQRTAEGVSVMLEVETVTALPLSYRQGQVATGVVVRHSSAVVRGDSVYATLDLQRTGNAAFLGRMQLELIEGSGRVLDRREEYVGVYHELRRVLPLSAAASRGEALRVRVRLDNRRDDLPPEGPLPAEPVAHVIAVTR